MMDPEQENESGEELPPLVPLVNKNKEKKRKMTNDRPSDEDYNLPSRIEDLSTNPKTVYLKGNLIGIGGFARVYQITQLGSQDRQTFADKVISKALMETRWKAEEKVKREIEIHRRMDHRHVVQFVTMFEDAKFVHIVLENCKQRSLLHMLKHRTTVTEPEARYYVRQILEGTRYIHEQRVLHRDLKLGNMLLSHDMVIKIGDFGLACRMEDSKPGTMCGTPNYIAPEVLSKAGHGVPADVWAIGCMMFAMLCGSPPFETQSLSATYSKISSCDYQVPASLSVEARLMIDLMLAKDPGKRGHLARPGAPNDQNLFSHVFFSAGVTPARLSTAAMKTVPVLAARHHQARTDSVAIPARTGRPGGGDDHGSCSLSPTPGSVGSAPVSPLGFLWKQKQRLGSWLDKSGRRKFLQRVVDNLGQCGVGSAEEPAAAIGMVPVFIIKWIDYSNKYGFGFEMSDGTVGVLFNDNTKIAANADRSVIEFTDIKGKVFVVNDNEYPQLSSRVKLLDYFIDYMDKNLADNSVDLEQHLSVVSPPLKSGVPQLKRWARKDESVVMELNNHLVQVNLLKDHLKMIVWEDPDSVMYLTVIDCEQQIVTHPMMSLHTAGCPPRLLARLEETVAELEALEGGANSEVSSSV